MPRLYSFSSGQNPTYNPNSINVAGPVYGIRPNFTGVPTGGMAIIPVRIPGVEGANFNTQCSYVWGAAGKIQSIYVPRTVSVPPATATYPGVTEGDLYGRATTTSNLDTIRALFDTNNVVMQYLPSGQGCMLYFKVPSPGPSTTYSGSWVQRFQLVDAVAEQVLSMSLVIWTGAGCEYALLSPLVYSAAYCNFTIPAP